MYKCKETESNAHNISSQFQTSQFPIELELSDKRDSLGLLAYLVCPCF